jgi:hypothetical protein
MLNNGAGIGAGANVGRDDGQWLGKEMDQTEVGNYVSVKGQKEGEMADELIASASTIDNGAYIGKNKTSYYDVNDLSDDHEGLLAGKKFTMRMDIMEDDYRDLSQKAARLGTYVFLKNYLPTTYQVRVRPRFGKCHFASREIFTEKRGELYTFELAQSILRQKICEMIQNLNYFAR